MRVEARIYHDAHRIDIRDNGIGIAQDKISDVMFVFGQSNSTTKDQNDGAGLGLPLTKALIEMHYGKMELKSVLGEGTTVSVFFPFKSD